MVIFFLFSAGFVMDDYRDGYGDLCELFELTTEIIDNQLYGGDFAYYFFIYLFIVFFFLQLCNIIILRSSVAAIFVISFVVVFISFFFSCELFFVFNDIEDDLLTFSRSASFWYFLFFLLFLQFCFLGVFLSFGKNFFLFWVSRFCVYCVLWGLTFTFYLFFLVEGLLFIRFLRARFARHLLKH